jgi:hypothetical protein
MLDIRIDGNEAEYIGSIKELEDKASILVSGIETDNIKSSFLDEVKANIIADIVGLALLSEIGENNQTVVGLDMTIFSNNVSIKAVDGVFFKSINGVN